MGFATLSRSTKKAREASKGRSVTSHYPPGIQMAIDAITLLDDTEPELVAAIARRKELLDRGRTDLAWRAEEIERCRKDPAHFVSNWAWTYDPRRSPSNIPFDLFDRQAEYLHWLVDRIRGKEDGLVEKSRDMGLSWLCCAFASHQLLFVPASKITFGSRKEILVDRIGDPDSLFEKIRMLVDQLPDWLRPKRYSAGFLKIVNEDIGSTITGESGDNMGRGGRSRLYFLDEFAFVARAQKVDAAVSNNSDVKIYVSTPNGTGNVFAKKRFSKRFPIFTFNWRDDPRKGQKWYERMKATLDAVILAQEVDIDYAASQEGIVIPSAWVQAAIDYAIPPVGDRVAGLDIADEGGDLNVCIIRRGVVIRESDITHWAIGNTTQTAYKARDLCEFHRVKQLNYDAMGVGAGVGGTLYSAENLRFNILPVVGGAAVEDEYLAEFNRSAKETFKNLRAQSWWELRRRFEKTYEQVNRLAEYDRSELISIPNHPELIAELSQPLYKFNDVGQIVIESKIDMKKRGVESPDFADALVYTFVKTTLNPLDWMKKA